MAAAAEVTQAWAPGRYHPSVRVLILDAPQSMLDERHRMGLDRRDEMWDGIVHLAPPAGDEHRGVSRLATLDGTLRVTWAEGSADI